jgi:CRISPR-associated protein Cas5d
MSRHPPLEVVVWGPLACFTRPEAKVERVSYPVMTPSAARGALEAVFWKPEMRWLIRQIHLLCPRIFRGGGLAPREVFEREPVRWQSLLRNEINSRQSHKGSVATGGAHYLADEDRAQRHTLALRDVRYLIRADVEVLRGASDDEAKHRDQFRRRVERGQCFQRPYLGCREFTCDFGEPVYDGSEWCDSKPLCYTADLGPTLFDIRFRQVERNGRCLGIGGEPVFFDARIERGVLSVPAELYQEVVPVCS